MPGQELAAGVAVPETVDSAMPRVITPGQSHVGMESGPPPSDLTVDRLLRQVAAEVPERLALMEPSGPDGSPGRRWTYAQLLAEAERGARALRRHCPAGTHLTIWAGNSPEWVLVQYAAALAGIVLVAANPTLRKPEIAYAMDRAGSRGVIYNRRYRDTDAEQVIRELRPETPWFELAIEDWAAFVRSVDEAHDVRDPVELAPSSAGDPVMIQYTSGTTGKPKAAVLPHRSIVNCGRFAALHLALERTPIWYMASPLFHTGGCVFGVLGTLWQRGTLVVPPEFDPGRMLDAVVHDGVIGATLVPTMCLRLLQARAERPVDVTGLEVIVGGGAPVAPELVRRLEQELGCEFLMVFGQTETGSAVSMSRRGDSVFHRSETVGRLFPNLEVRIVDPGDGVVVPLGEPGEIQLRGYMAFTEYLGMPEETAETLDAEGWLRTGDLGTVDADGYLTVDGRLKNLIIRGGEKIFPREVEDVLATHPGVRNAAVFGLPDPQWGEIVAAAVVRVEGADLDPDELIGWLRERVARYKVPAHIHFVSELPTTPTGKVQTFVLRDTVLREQEQT